MPIFRFVGQEELAKTLRNLGNNEITNIDKLSDMAKESEDTINHNLTVLGELADENLEHIQELSDEAKKFALTYQDTALEIG